MGKSHLDMLIEWFKAIRIQGIFKALATEFTNTSSAQFILWCIVAVAVIVAIYWAIRAYHNWIMDKYDFSIFDIASLIYHFCFGLLFWFMYILNAYGRIPDKPSFPVTATLIMLIGWGGWLIYLWRIIGNFWVAVGVNLFQWVVSFIASTLVFLVFLFSSSSSRDKK